ncbi:transferase family-domain-containing protein [Xylariaceae sp. AK1471]|nr:transferase family-domain-containing protein [Xylariaceae sp. AK1471]
MFPDLVSVTARYQLHCADNEVLVGLESPFRLGPLDHMGPRFIPIDVVFVYEKPTLGSNASDNELIPVNRLLQALCRLLDYYPHLTGRFHFNTENNTPEITALGTGGELIEARCGKQLDDIASLSSSGRILITNLPGSGVRLFAPFDPTTEGVCHDPMFTVQHTRFACGGVALGIRLPHTVCDAHGFFNLVNDLAEIYRALPSSSNPALSQPPEIRPMLRGPYALSAEQRQDALRYQPIEYNLKDDTEQENVSAKTVNNSSLVGFETVGRVLRFSGQDLAALKEEATNPSGKGWVSTTEALTAYICQKIYCARLEFLESKRLPPSAVGPQTLPFKVSIDMRAPDRLNLYARYFPNCVHNTYINALHPSIATSPLWEVAQAVHHLIRAVDPERMRKTNQWIAAQPDKGNVRLGFHFGPGSFHLTQWSKFNMYKGNHLDVDKNGEPILPALVAPPFVQGSLVENIAFLLATEEQAMDQPAVDVNLSAIKPVWDILDADESFRKYYS